MAKIGPSLTKSSAKMFEISSSDSSEVDSDDESRPKPPKTSSCQIRPNSGGLSILLSSKIASVPKISGDKINDNRKIAKISSNIPTTSSSFDDDLFLIDKSSSEEKKLTLKIDEKSKLDDKKSIKKKKDEEFEEILLSSTLDDGEIEQKASNYIDFDRNSNRKHRNNSSNFSKSANLKVDSKRVDEVMKKSVITPEFHKKETVPTYYQSLKAQKKQRKLEREKTKGKDWFNMPATEMTEERKHDLEIMQIRDTFDTKTFYRKEDRKVLPKYFQIGTVVEDPTDFYSDRIPKKQRKQTIVDELLADAEFQKFHKEKYKQIIAKKEKLKRNLRPKKTNSKKKRN